MCYRQSMHVQAHLLDCVCNIRRVNVKYCKAPAMLRYEEASLSSSPLALDGLAEVSAGVLTGLQLCIPSHSSTSRA
jgi:hypothetical protein